MFDISWTEFLLIGVVALIFIGPKELPAVLRTVGQWTRRIRSMAADFQGQFQEAMREAEMADLKKQVDDIAHDVKNYDPLKEVRTGVEAAGKDIQSSLEKPVESAGEATTAPSETLAVTEPAAAAAAPIALDVVAGSVAPADTAAALPPIDYLGEATVAATAPVVPEAAVDVPKADTPLHDPAGHDPAGHEPVEHDPAARNPAEHDPRQETTGRQTAEPGE
jgi:sec-independent protein translocase protein TatB